MGKTSRVFDEQFKRMALANRKPEKGMVFHSDRGVQYACGAFKEALSQAGANIRQSMSRKGNCWDNAPMESFYKTLKAEEVNRHHFRTKQEAKLVIFEYIEGWYNRKRLHSTLGYLTPCQAEKSCQKKPLDRKAINLNLKEKSLQ